MDKEKIYLKISNEGEIEPNSLKLLGASSKEGEGKIGYFGSGSKYALAVLLRNKINFKIFSGLREIKIGTSKTKFRGKSFEIIKVNGRMTSLTTEMGKDWKIWSAFRELYCNAIDEGDYGLDITDEIAPVQGLTNIYIQYNDKFEEILKNWDMYFSDKRTDTILEYKDNKIFFSKDDLIIYRKGIRVHKEGKKSLFNYDFGWITINESRSIDSLWSFQYDLVKWLGNHADKKVIAEIYDNFRETYEGGLSWEYCGYYNKDWLDVLGGRSIILEDTAGGFLEEMSDRTITLPNQLAKSLKKWFGKEVHILGYSEKYGNAVFREPNERQKFLIEECLSFLKRAGLEIKYRIKMCDFDNEGQLGGAIVDTIFLSPCLFDMGKKEIIATIIEEYAHLDSRAGDKTRNFQNYLIKKYIGVLEEKLNEYL